MKGMSNPVLHVDARALALQLKPLGLTKVSGDALVSFDGNELCVTLGGVTTHVGATGTWPGVARIPGRFWVGLSRWLAERERVEILIVSEDKVVVQDGHASVEDTCAWSDGSIARIDVPLGARVIDWLAIAELHPDRELKAAGILPDVEEAREVRDECLPHAAALLSRVGIDEADLRELLAQKARRKRQPLAVAEPERFAAALHYAATVHGSQCRKGTKIPYVSHLMAVASIAMEYGANEDEAIAAVLHDAVEDCGGEPIAEQIGKMFGDGVRDIVLGCSDSTVDTGKTEKLPWKERKRAYLEHLRDSSDSVAFVSAADKLHNVRSMVADYRELGESLFARFNASRAEQLWFYRSVADVLTQRPGSTQMISLARELDRTVKELETLATQ